MSFKNVGIIGAGTMGNGIAQAVASAGIDVLLIDVSESALSKGIATLSESLQRLVAKGALDAPQADAVRARIKTSTDYASLAVVDLVIEAVTENFTLKRRILEQVEAVVGPSAVIASNTSSISI